MEFKKGQRLPDWRLATVGGTSRAFREFRGKPALVVGWASWDPSREMLPALEAFHRKNRDHLELVTVAFDVQGPEFAMKFLMPAHFTHSALIDACFHLCRAWGIRSIPFAALADAEGFLQWFGPPDEALFPQVLSALKKKPERKENRERRLPAKYPRYEVLLQGCANFLGRGRKDDALGALKDADGIDPSNTLTRRQIAAIDRPERFYRGPIEAEGPAPSPAPRSRRK